MMNTLCRCKAILCILFLSKTVLAASSVQRHDNKSRDSKNGKLQCTSVELQTKDCSLMIASSKIHLTRYKISSYDGIWRAMLKTPLTDGKSEWHDASLHTLRNRTFLTLYVWSPPQAASGVEDLRWYVYEFTDKEIKLKKDSVVQKRRPVQEPHALVKGALPHEKFVSDSMLKHNLGLNKENKIEVNIEAEKSILED
jgi:hypothetical protein